MTKTKSTFLALIAVLLSPIAANADLIVSGALLDDIADSADGTSFGRLYIADWTFTTGVAANFYEDLSSASVGTTFVYDSGSQFDDAVTVLTDGLLDALFGLADFSGGGIFGDDFYGGASLNGVDLAGYIIDSIEWTIDSYVYDAGAGSVSMSSSLGIYGQLAQVPEPGTLALLGIGIFGMGLARRKKA